MYVKGITGKRFCDPSIVYTLGFILKEFSIQELREMLQMDEIGIYQPPTTPKVFEVLLALCSFE